MKKEVLDYFKDYAETRLEQLYDTKSKNCSQVTSECLSMLASISQIEQNNVQAEISKGLESAIKEFDFSKLDFKNLSSMFGGMK